MEYKTFNNPLLLLLSKKDLQLFLSNNIWKIDILAPDIYLIYIYDKDNVLIEKYNISLKDKELTIIIEIYNGTKEINLPFYFALDIFYDIRNDVDIRYITITKKTSIDGIKKFHGNIKKTQLQHVINKLRKTGTIKNIALLDLCCGKGNDMAKWHSLGIHNVVGIDYSEESILDAQHRFFAKNYPSSYNVHFIRSDVGAVDPTANKYLSNFLTSISTPDETNKKFDIVSCNFAIHYMYAHEANLRNFMAIINKYLRIGGYFIGTTLNKDLILKLFPKKETSFSAPLLEITPKEHFFDNSKIYGRKYGIRIGLVGENTYTGKEESNEFLVDFREMRAIAYKNGLMLIELVNFNQIAGHDKLNQNEKPASWLNTKFMFYKQF
jgi:SAM-dependent methyltransferase